MKRLLHHSLTAAVVLLAGALSGCAPEEPWNVVVFTWDTTRADHLGCYGMSSAQTPNVDALADEGYLFEQAFSTVPITLPSHSTIFTGTYPFVHGVRDNVLFKLPESRTTLAEILRDRGYATGAAVGSFPLTRQFGLSQGFDFYDDAIDSGPRDGVAGVHFEDRPAAQVNGAILPWIREQAPKSPFFAWIHYFDPHHPLTPPAPWAETFAFDPYLGEIASADASLGAVIRTLRALGVYERTLIVFTADHGEGRGEHNEDTHSLLAYNATLHVPLIARVPDLPGGVRFSQRVGTVDIAPTVLDLLDIAAPESTQGRTLAPLIERPDSEQADRHPYYAETLAPRLSYGLGELRALYLGNKKYIHGPRAELFDLATDPGEVHDLMSAEASEAERMRALLERFLEQGASATAAEAVTDVDATVRARMAALGYLSAGGESPDTIRETLRSDGITPHDRVADNSLMSQAKQLLTERSFLEAKEAADRLLARDPSHPYYLNLLAQSYIGLGKLDEAATLIEQSDAILPMASDIFVQVAWNLFVSGEQERGLRLAEKLSGGQPTGNAYFRLAGMHEALGDTTSQEEALRQAIELSSTHGEARLDLAVLLAGKQQLAEAESHFKTLLQQDPFNARFHHNYGVLLHFSGAHAAAIDQLVRATELDGRYWDAHLSLIEMLRLAGRTDEAMERFELVSGSTTDPETRRRIEEISPRD